MDVIFRTRTTDHGKAGLNKIKRLLKKRVAATKPKLNSVKNSSDKAEPKVNSLDNSSTEVNPKVNALKNASLREDKIKPNTKNKKRKSEASLECPLIKRSKMDHCEGTLTKLMKHKWSVPFIRPVDRDASGDYFQVIEHPMDFGTIKRKLQQNKYPDDEEFEADVRRIFANAVLYHPSNNWVHMYATKLSKLFDILWLSVKPKPAEEPIIEQPAKEPIIEQNNTGGSFAKHNGLEVEPDYSSLRAARVAKLKARFADTIVRAKSKIGNPLDNRARIAAETKATVLASQMKAEEYQLKNQREREREAARASLEQMERSVTLDDNLGAMRDLEALMGSTMQVVCHGTGAYGSWIQAKSGRRKIPLEQLGLFIKPEYCLGYADDDDLFLQAADLEEGEIC